jgi:hypothetical protein
MWGGGECETQSRCGGRLSLAALFCVIIYLRRSIIPFHTFELLLVDRVEAYGASDPLGVLGRGEIVQNARKTKHLDKYPVNEKRLG